MREQRRVQVIAGVAAGQVTTGEAAGLLGVSDRQVRRLRDAYMHSGVPGLAHGNKGRSPANQTPPEVAEEALRLCGPEGPYHDFNVCHAAQMLAERHDITLGRSTLERLLRESGTRARRRKRPVVKRSRRERSAQAGMMIQIDGSPHDWLEGRAPRMCLMGAIDDATSAVVYARFHKTEDQAGYLMLLRGVCTRYGVPMSVYHDRHSILRSPKQPSLEEELAGVKPMSQVQRVMEELGIEAIAAHSPQAKGRVERLWKSLQDRLAKEMRLAGIATMEAANAFLPGFLQRYNERFAVAPRDETPAWVSLGESPDTDRLFSTRELRVVMGDHTVSFEGTAYLLLRSRKDKSLAGRRIAVHVTPEGEIVFYDGTTRLTGKVCREAAPVVERPVQAVVPEAVRLALEARRSSFLAYRGLPLRERPTSQAMPASP